MQLLQKVVQIALKPRCRVIGLLCRDTNPGLILHVLLSLAVLIHRKLVQLVRFDDLRDKFGLLFELVGDWKLLELLQDGNDRVNWVILIRGMA